MVIVYNLKNGEIKKFPSIETTYKYYQNIPAEQIDQSITTGESYKSLLFDVVK